MEVLMDIANGIATGIGNFLTGGLVAFLQQLIPSLQVLFGFLASMPIDLTTGNAFVIQAWTTMTVIADAFLGLFVIIGTIQIMYGDVTGGLRMPLPQFLGKAILTGILIHLSAFIGTELLLLNNALSEVVGANVKTSLNAMLTQLLVAGGTNGIVTLILSIVVALSIFRLVFQGVTRVLRFNLLFVLAGPAFLLSLLPATEPVFEGWMRMLCATAFEQFVQFLALSLVLQFLLSAAQANLAGLLLTIAAFGLAGEVPNLMGQLVGSGSSKGGAGALSAIVKAAVLIKFFI
jgi:hypothetical protein